MQTHGGTAGPRKAFAGPLQQILGPEVSTARMASTAKIAESNKDLTNNLQPKRVSLNMGRTVPSLL
jgi:hypothetical protein